MEGEDTYEQLVSKMEEYKSKGNCYISMKDYTEAKKSYSSIIMLGKKLLPESKKQKSIYTVPQLRKFKELMASAYLNTSIAYIKEGNPQIALERILQGLAIRPRNLKLLFNAAKLYIEKKEYRTAWNYLMQGDTIAKEADTKKDFAKMIDSIKDKWNMEKEKEEMGKEEGHEGHDHDHDHEHKEPSKQERIAKKLLDLESGIQKTAKDIQNK